MSFSDRLIRLELLGYILLEYEFNETHELHFVKAKDIAAYNERQWHFHKMNISGFIYDLNTKSWTKERSPLEAMPLSENERILYGRSDS